MIDMVARKSLQTRAPYRSGRSHDTPATRAALTAAASELFGEHGFEGVRVEQIARRAGVNKAMISYHFGGKRGLYGAILEDLFEGINAELSLLGRTDAPADERLREFVGVIAAHCSRRPAYPAMLIREVIGGGKHIPDSMLPRFLSIFQCVRGIVEAGVGEGTFRAVDPILTHLTIVGSLVFFFATSPMRSRMFRAGRMPRGVAAPSPEAFVVHIQELMTRGLSADTAAVPSRR
jgi:TetR/AcrR family transcriptional regulator